MLQIRTLFPTILVIALLGIGWAHAQDPPALTADDPPFAPLIAITQEDDFTVRVVGEAGAAFPAAQVAVRNLYTGETVFAAAAANGSFEARLGGTANMPYQVNSARAYPLAERDSYDVIPGAGVVVYPPAMDEANFGIGGQLSYGASYWLANGEINRTEYAPGDAFSLTLDAHLFAPESDPSLEYTLAGSLALRRLFDEEGQPLSTVHGAGEGWSSELVLGLPVLGRHVPDIPLADSESVMARATFPPEEEATAEPEPQDIIPGEIAFSLEFSGPVPGVEPGLYALVFTGQAAVGDSEPFDWYANRVFSAGAPDAAAGDSATVLPVLLQIGEVGAPRLLWSLLDATAAEDAGSAAIADTIQHVPETPVRAPGEYTLEPRLYGTALLPLVSGQVRLGTDETSVSTAAYPALRDGLPYLETYDERFMQEFFAASGASEIEVAGALEDAFGRRYTGGGTYAVQFAEPLTLHSPVLPGTPLIVGQSFPADFAISPRIPNAEKRVFLRFLSLDGRITERELSQDFAFTEPGLYVVDLYAQAEAGDTIWAGSQRAVAVVTQGGEFGDPQPHARGVRGLANYQRAPQVWYDTAVYPADAPPTLPILNFPFFVGDLVYLPDGAEVALNPILGDGEIQVVSVVHPAWSVRQFLRAADADIGAWFTADSTLGGQIGEGSDGLRPDDVLYLFGGALDADSVRGYAATAIITNGESGRVVPPFGETLLQDRGEDVQTFLQPTGIRPGEVVAVGEALTNRGIIPVAVPSVATTITLPDGQQLQTAVRTGDYGYFEGESLVFNLPGVYAIETYSGWAARDFVREFWQVTAPVLGVADAYYVFALPEDAAPLETSLEAVTTVQQPFTIPLRVPDGWTEVTWYTVVRTPQWVLEQNAEPLAGAQATYFFDAGLFARAFPFLEPLAGTPADRDEITFIFAMTGTDSAGEAQIRARTFTLRGTTLYTFED